MNILLSAYACEPHKGSEPGVGWNWLLELVKSGHNVSVLTRSNNKKSIDEYLELTNSCISRVNFIYFDLNPSAQLFKKRLNATLLYYLLWQFGAYLYLKNNEILSEIDVIHHLTFGSVRHFSFLCLLKKPFILGPIGGGETSPFWLRPFIGFRGFVGEYIRDIANYLVFLDPIHRLGLKKATLIACKTDQSVNLIPKKYRHKVITMTEIGITTPPHLHHQSPTEALVKCKKCLFVGRFLPWKGILILLRIFAVALRKDPCITLTIIGEGPQFKKIYLMIHKLGIDKNVTLVPWIPKNELIQYYKSHGIFLFPSLHDSSGNVILEAASFGLPAIGFDLGGVGYLIKKYKLGMTISTNTRMSMRLLEQRFSDKILELASNPDIWQCNSISVSESVRKLTWASRISELNFI